MKKILKRMVSMLLVGILSMQMAAFAVEVSVSERGAVDTGTAITQLDEQRFADFAKGKTLLEESMTELNSSGSTKIYLRGYEYTNHDFCNQEIENNVVVAETYFDYSENLSVSYERGSNTAMTITPSSATPTNPYDDSDDEEVIDEEDAEEESGSKSVFVDGDLSQTNDSAIAFASTTPYTRKGKILYKVNGQASTYGVHVAYRTTMRKEIKFNVNGEYRNAAEIAATLCWGLSIPLSVANGVAGAVVQALHLAIVVGEDIVLPNYYVTSTRTTRWWRLREMHNTSHEVIMKGRKYYVTAKNYTGKKNYYKGDYYRPSEFAKKDPLLAEAIIVHMCNPYTWSVKEWDIY